MALRVIRFAVVFMIASLAAGCSSGTDHAALEKPDIVLDVFPSIDTAGLYIAKMDGLFAAQGLNVTIRFATSSQAAVQGQEHGIYDITSADYVTYIDDELTAGAHLRLIAEASFLQPSVLALLVPAHSPVQTVAQLRGKTIAVVAPDDIATLLVDSLLTENGVLPSQVTFKPGVALPAVGAALNAGAIDAAPAPEPFISVSEEKYGTQQLVDLDQGSTANFPIQGFAVTEAWARKYPATLRAFLRALSAGPRVADTNRPAVERAVEKFLGIPAVTASLIALPNVPLSVNATRLQRVVNAMVEFGLLPAKDASFKISAMTG
jgi:NitT/TauT family transport system substrate-binding protein